MTAATDFDNDVRLAIYRRFVDDGVAPTHVDIARDLGEAPADVEAAFHRLADAHVIVLAPDTSYIWMANPLSAIPTPFEVRTADGRHYFGNCIWDALGILAMLKADGTVTTSCPDCSDVLSLTVEGEAVRDAAGVVHYAVPAARWWDDIGFT